MAQASVACRAQQERCRKIPRRLVRITQRNLGGTATGVGGSAARIELDGRIQVGQCRGVLHLAKPGLTAQGKHRSARLMRQSPVAVLDGLGKLLETAVGSSASCKGRAVIGVVLQISA